MSCREFFLFPGKKIDFWASNEPSVYAASGTRFSKSRIDTGLLLSGLRDSILWYGRISRSADTNSTQNKTDGMADIKTTDQELYCASNYSMGGVTPKRPIAPNGDFKVHLVSVIIIIDRNIILPRY